MAISATNLTADLGANDVTMVVASGTGFPTAGTTIANPGYLVQIDTEQMLAIQQPVSGTIKIAMRGYNGTAARAHDNVAHVLVSSDHQDFSPVAAGNQVAIPPATPVQETLGEDRTFTSAQIAAWGLQTRNFAITKATACLFTFVAPSEAQNGLVVVITSLTAAAHVLTATSLLGDAVSGSPHTTGTFAAFIGTTLTLQAQNGIWNVVSSTGITVT